MKKSLLFVLALLLCVGVSQAANIPTAVDPQNYPEIWTMEVFNDSGSTLTSGSVVVWDYTDSDMTELANRKMYITTTTTADDIATAGITVDPSIANQDVGTICIFGPVKARIVSGTVATAGVALATSTTAGRLGNYAGAGNNDACLGWSIQASTDAEDEGGADISTVFVNPTILAD